MPKSKTTTEINDTEGSLYPKSDYTRIQQLIRLTYPSKQDMDDIFMYYKKFINPSVLNYTSKGCQTCGSSIVKMWSELRDWIGPNHNKFEK